MAKDINFEEELEGPKGPEGPPGLRGPDGLSLTKEQIAEIMALIMAAKPKESVSFFKKIKSFSSIFKRRHE